MQIPAQRRYFMQSTRKKKAMISFAVCVASIVFALPAAARIEADPQYGDVIVMYSEPAQTAEEADPLCSFINIRRSENGSGLLTISEELTAQAERRAGQLADGSGRADAGTLHAEAASETIIRGNADINTMISAILLSEQQTKNLLYADYKQIGYACNEEQTVWVLLMTS